MGTGTITINLSTRKLTVTSTPPGLLSITDVPGDPSIGVKQGLESIEFLIDGIFDNLVIQRFGFAIWSPTYHPEDYYYLEPSGTHDSPVGDFSWSPVGSSGVLLTLPSVQERWVLNCRFAAGLVDSTNLSNHPGIIVIDPKIYNDGT